MIVSCTMSSVSSVTVFYSVLCVALVIAMIVTLTRSPLFPFRMSDLDWTQDWLIFSVRCCMFTVCVAMNVVSEFRTATGCHSLKWRVASSSFIHFCIAQRRRSSRFRPSLLHILCEGDAQQLTCSPLCRWQTTMGSACASAG